MMQRLLQQLRRLAPLAPLAALAILGLGAHAQAQTAPGGSNSLGAQVAPNGTTVSFRLYSASATRVEVSVFRQSYGAQPVAKYVLGKVSGSSLWQVNVPVATLRNLGFDVDPTNASKLFTNVFYGYRVWGPNWTYSASWTPGSSTGFVADVDSAGNRFNPNKLLLDPYALEVTHDYTSTLVSPQLDNATLFASGPYRLSDSGPQAPKGIVAMPFGAGFAQLTGANKPTGAAKDDVIYEAHLRGLSMGDASVGTCAGTYAGAVAKIPYLQSLGITAIEFMPVQETENQGNDMNDPANQRSPTTTYGDNYWGYMTDDFFAPARRYACDQSIGGPTREFAAMVQAFHQAGIKVMTDVVYNHTSEGGNWTLTVNGVTSPDPNTANLWSYRGIDNATYYLLTRAPGSSSDENFYYDITGTGNTMNTANPTVQQLFINSMNYQRNVLGVDAFRFDIGMALVNTYDNTSNPSNPTRFNFDRTNPNTAMAQIIAAFPGVYLSGEPWGPAGDYQGQMPVGYADWNGEWRDTVRRTLNKYGVKDSSATRALIATRVAGSADLFGGNGDNHPWYSVNFLNVHDGFTLNDVFSCDSQNMNQPWPLGPSDGGSTDEDQWDSGGVASAQRQQARTGFALLMLSAGVPIFHAGDEYLRSLNCNNNSYNVDSVGTWLNWNWTQDQQNFNAFASKLIAFRKAEPGLHPNNFYASVSTNGDNMAPLDWFGADGSYMTNSSNGSWWNATPASPDSNGQNRTLEWRYDGSQLGGGDLVLVLFNGEPTFRNFTLPWTGANKSTWCRVTDTAAWAEGGNQVDLSASTCVGGQNSSYGVNPRSLVILIAK